MTTDRVFILCESAVRRGMEEDIHQLKRGIHPRDRRIVYITHCMDLQRMQGYRGPSSSVFMFSRPDQTDVGYVDHFVAARDFRVAQTLAEAFDGYDTSFVRAGFSA